jgi:hypothetical protein
MQIKLHKTLLGAVGLSAVLASCGVTAPAPEPYLKPNPELRTNYIDIATDRYVACDLAFGAIPLRQNIASVEFSAPAASSAEVELIGEKTDDKSFALVSELRTSSRGNFIADVVIFDRLVPADLSAQAVTPQYQYVSLTSRPRGSFRAQVTIDTPSGRETATTGSVLVYDTCAYLRNTESRD